MNAIENIKTRNSHSKLIEPFPSKAEMKLVYESAMRAPDHANLKPSNFIEVTGKGLLKLSKVFSFKKYLDFLQKFEQFFFCFIFLLWFVQINNHDGCSIFMLLLIK